MRIQDSDLGGKIAEAAAVPIVRRTLLATIKEAKSATQLSEELGIPVRTVYRYIRDLSEIGLLAAESWHYLCGGGKYALYRSMVRSVTVEYGSTLEVDLIPNEEILRRFMRFWSYLGRQ